MTSSPAATCPSCQSPLVLEHAGLGATIICAGCRHRFTLGAAADEPKTSGKAVASLMLGLGAMFLMCLTGIPAIVLAILALRDIHRSEGKTKGRGLAIAGLATGSLFGILCTPVSVAVMLPAVQVMRTPPREYVEAAQIAAVAEKLPDHRPPGLTPIYAFEDARQGMRQVVYADQPHDASTLAFLSQGSATHAWTRRALERQMRGWEQDRGLKMTVRESEELQWTIAGRPVNVTRETGLRVTDGASRRRYVGYLEQGQKLLAVMVTTADRPPDASDDDASSLTEQQVHGFFQSIQTRR